GTPLTVTEFELPPVLLRHCSETPFPGAATISTYIALAASESRNITPALAHGSVFVREFTRAMMLASPVRGWEAKLKASLFPQMSAPEPITVNEVPSPLAVPAPPTAPTSWSDQGAGNGLAGAVAV